MPDSRADNILITAGGFSHTLSKLAKQKQTPPTPDDLRLVEIIMEKTTHDHVDVLEVMYDHAITWLDLGLWRRVLGVHMTAPSLAHPYDKFGEAVKVFPFADCCAT